jgi:hypothetical protein
MVETQKAKENVIIFIETNYSFFSIHETYYYSYNLSNLLNNNVTFDHLKYGTTNAHITIFQVFFPFLTSTNQSNLSDANF